MNQYSVLLKQMFLECNDMLRKNESLEKPLLIPSKPISELSSEEYLNKFHRVVVRNILRDLLDKVYYYINNSIEISPYTKVKAPIKGGAEYQDVSRLRQYLPFALEDQKKIFVLVDRLIIQYANRI